VSKSQDSLNLFEVDSSARCPLSLVDFNSLVLNSDLAIGIVDTLYVDDAVGVSSGVADVGVGECNLSWFVIVKDGNADFGITTVELIAVFALRSVRVV